jgi:hypothetical protein
MWRNVRSAYFRDLKFHNGGILGFKSKPVTSYIRIKHYGYVNVKQIEERNKTYERLKKDPMAKKTLPMDERGLKLEEWREYENIVCQNIFQRADLIKWNFLQLTDSLISFF